MAFVLKKTKRVTFEKDGESFVLIMHKIKLQKVLSRLEGQIDELNKSREALEDGKTTVGISVELLESVSALIKEAAVGWEGITDESGNAIEYSPENFDEVFGYDMGFYTIMMNALIGSNVTAESEKNAPASSGSVVH